MECDLDEVSGQMALPLPKHTAARSLEPYSRFPAAHALPDVVPLIVSKVKDLLTILNAANRWSASGPGWPLCAEATTTRGTAPRAEGVKPDDRTLETAARPFRRLFRGRGGRCDRHGLVARSQINRPMIGSCRSSSTSNKTISTPDASKASRCPPARSDPGGLMSKVLLIGLPPKEAKRVASYFHSVDVNTVFLPSIESALDKVK